MRLSASSYLSVCLSVCPSILQNSAYSEQKSEILYWKHFLISAQKSTCGYSRTKISGRLHEEPSTFILLTGTCSAVVQDKALLCLFGNAFNIYVVDSDMRNSTMHHCASLLLYGNVLKSILISFPCKSSTSNANVPLCYIKRTLPVLFCNSGTETWSLFLRDKKFKKLSIRIFSKLL
jgi:hypothetical protein